MKELDDIEIQQDIEQIMNNVDNIMKKVEDLYPSKQEEPATENENITVSPDA
ncbi:MAG: hypothetical protein K9L30_13540 [Desulfobacterales bacterium]|nr:hypothetical protein [Desulfobacterales bacterium]